MNIANNISRTIFALAVCALCSLDAVATPLPAPVRDELKHANIPLNGVGILVQEVGSNIPLLSHNATRAMNPASTMKLLTTIAALEILGPAYRWKTEVFLDGKLDNGVLDGNLVFKGYGDPKLTIEQFWLWLRELRQRGLRDIRGDIVLDRSYFALPQYDPAEFDRDPTRAYNVGPNALLLNFNALHLRLIPNGTGLDALLDPELSGYTFRNRLVSVAGARCSRRDNYDVNLDKHDLVLRGRVGANCDAIDHYFSLLPHSDYFFAVFGALWKELGGTIDGKVRDGRAPEHAMPYATHLSIPLSEVIRDINKFSNNLMARQLYLTLGVPVDYGADMELSDDDPEPVQGMQPASEDDAMNTPQLSELAAASSTTPTDNPAASGVPDVTTASPARADFITDNEPVATINKSRSAVNSWLKTAGLNFPELVMENGAGLSRVARISPENLAALLQHAADGRYAAELEASLPLLGLDGTLRKRFNDDDLTGYAHIKTGLLTGVKSIAGYVKGQSGKRWIVVFLINNRHASAGQGAQDALLEWVQRYH